MSLLDNLKQSLFSLKNLRKKESGISEILNYAAMVAPGVMLGKDGSLTAGWWLEGKDLTSSSMAEKEKSAFLLNQTLNRYDNGWTIQHYSFRLDANEYRTGEYPNIIAQIMDDERRDAFNGEGNHYKTIMALTVTYMPPLSGVSKVKDMVFDETEIAEKDPLNIRQVKWFNQRVNTLAYDLSNTYNIRRMSTVEVEDEYGQHHMYDELLSFVNLCITGEDNPIKLPPCAMYIDSLVGQRELVTGMIPKIGNQYVSNLVISGFPPESYANILDGLDRLPLKYRLSHRFIVLGTEEAKGIIKKLRREWQQKRRGFFAQLFNSKGGAINLDADMKVHECERALADAESGEIKFGYYTCTMSFFHTDKEVVDNNSQEALKIIRSAGFDARIEDINSVEAWLGTLPSHGFANLRKPLMSTVNLADFIPTVTMWTGSEYAPCPFFPNQSPPLMMAKSEGNTPFNVNLHVGDVGHTLIVGPTGSGKSTLLATLVAQFMKYPDAMIWSFDKGYSMKGLTLACGGSHYDMMSDKAEGEKGDAFYPLSRISQSKEEEAWAIDWISDIVMLAGVDITPDMREKIQEGVKSLAKTESHTLTDLCNEIQHDEVTQVLEYYTLTGTTGELLDSTFDTIESGKFQTIELEHLMNKGPRIVIPVLTYLFRKIERSFKGQPTLLVLDEAWIMLGNPVFKEKLREWFKVLRKANCSVVLATQSVSDLQQSGIVDVIQESCPTKIYLPNSEARHAGTPSAPGPYDLYKAFGLNDAQIDIITRARPKQDYYMSTPMGSRLFQLGLNRKQLCFVGASGKDDLKRIDELRRYYPNTWAYQWLIENRAITKEELIDRYNVDFTEGTTFDVKEYHKKVVEDLPESWAFKLLVENNIMSQAEVDEYRKAV